MNERIKKLRKYLDLTQKEFGERIGIKGNTIANYELGRNEPIDAVVSLICREFNVSEEWLRNGTGKMFKPSSNSALDALATEFNLDHSSYVAIEKFLKLSPELREGMIAYFRDVTTALADDEDDIFRDVPDTAAELEGLYPPIDITQGKELG